MKRDIVLSFMDDSTPMKLACGIGVDIATPKLSTKDAKRGGRVRHEY